MESDNISLLLGIELTLLLNLVLAAAVFFLFRELKSARKRNMHLIKERSKLKRNSTSSTTKAVASPTQYLEESLAASSEFIAAQYPDIELDKSIEQPDSCADTQHKALVFRHLLMTQELTARKSTDSFNLTEYQEHLSGQSSVWFEANNQAAEAEDQLDSDDDKSVPDTPVNQSSDGHLEGEVAHYRKLYDDLLITLKKSKDTIRSLALRLSEIIDDGMDEEQLNVLVEELNNSMDAFGELSGISLSSANDQLEDEVKEIRKAYEQGMNLMDHFENALKSSDETADNIKEHANLVDTNKLNYESGETVDRDKALADTQRYVRILVDGKKFSETLNSELSSAKKIIGDFLAMTRKFQDQSTRIVILQSREKQLDSDLRQLKSAQQESLKYLKARDIQLDALNKKVHESSDSEMNEKLIELAKQVYETEQEIAELEEGNKSKRNELIQKRMGIEIKILDAVGLND
ncbi:MAG: hypothetical protein V2I33_02090 [Kangiellaceae bacterium]|jgi:hypothetical protein|nr:hypothetical protein [Kangiellaceae bacterium]